MIPLNPIEFARAVGRIIKALLTGKKLIVTHEVARCRAETCQERDGDCYEGSTGQCRLCSCFTGPKVWLATESCPRGLWKRALLKTQHLG